MVPRTPLRYPAEYVESHGATVGRAALVVLGLWLTIGVALALYLWQFVASVADPTARRKTGEAVGRILPGVLLQLLVILAVAWLLVAVGLHVATRWRGGNGPFGKTLAVAGLGMAAEVVGVVVAFGLLWLQLRGVEFTATDPETLARQARSVLDGLGAAGTLVTLATTVWSTYVWAGGLTVVHDLEPEDGVLAAGVVGVVVALFAVV